MMFTRQTCFEEESYGRVGVGLDFGSEVEAEAQAQWVAVRECSRRVAAWSHECFAGRRVEGRRRSWQKKKL